LLLPTLPADYLSILVVFAPLVSKHFWTDAESAKGMFGMVTVLVIEE